MVCVMPQHDGKGGGGKTTSKPGLEQAWPAGPDPAGGKETGSTLQSLKGKGEKNGFCSSDGSMEKLLASKDGGASPYVEALRSRVVGKHHMPYGACVLALLAVILALVVALAVVAAGRRGDSPVLALTCPDDWVWYRSVCYYLSSEEATWEQSRERCSSLGASLAVLRGDWEMGFVSRLRGTVDYWIGLRRWDGHLEWVDGSGFSQTILVQGQEPCLFLSDRDLRGSSCSLPRRYICSKPHALVGRM